MLNIMLTLPCECYILSETDSISMFSMLPISDNAWTEQQFMRLVSPFAYVYFKAVSAPLVSICYLGSHACVVY